MGQRHNSIELLTLVFSILCYFISFTFVRRPCVDRKRICDFLLVINSNFGLSRTVSEINTATYWLKIAYISYPSLFRHPRSLWSFWNFALKLIRKKLEIHGATCSDSCMILTSTVFDWNIAYPCDGRTDRLMGDGMLSRECKANRLTARSMSLCLCQTFSLHYPGDEKLVTYWP